MAGINNITREVAPKSMFEDAVAVISSAVSYAQGDLLVFDETANLLKVPAAEAEGSTFLGVAIQTLVSGKLPSPYNTDVVASQAVQNIAGPKFGVIAKLILKTGDSLAPGDSVYLYPAGGARAVQAAGTKAIGIYQGKSVTAIAGTEVEVLIGCRFKDDILKF